MKESQRWAEVHRFHLPKLHTVRGLPRARQQQRAPGGEEGATHEGGAEMPHRGTPPPVIPTAVPASPHPRGQEGPAHPVWSQK